MLLGILYATALLGTYLWLLKREQKKNHKKINQSLEDLKKQHVGD